MSQKIYHLLNDITIDLSEYKEEDMGEVAEERWIRNAKRSVRKRSIKKILKPVAAVAILVIGTGYTLPTYAMTNPLLHKIADFMGVNKSLDRYSKVINETVTKKGLMIELGEVILDNDEVTVTARITNKDEPLPKDFMLVEGDIYINGKGVRLDGGGCDRQLDDHTLEVAMSTIGVEEFRGDVDIKIIFREFMMNEERVRGKWVFEFTANGDELIGETIEIPLEQTLVLPNRGEIIVERYTANKVSQKIYFRKQVPSFDYQMEFKLYDALGNEFKAQSASIDTTGGVFKWEGIDVEAEHRNNILILTLRKAEWGKEYEEADQGIQIDLNNSTPNGEGH